MDVAKLLLRQLKVADGFAETQADRDCVQWWKEQVLELRKAEPHQGDEPQLGLLAAEPTATYSVGGGRK